MRERIVNADITLTPYFPNEAVTLAWYQDPELCRQVDNIDQPYSLERLRAMYTYLSTHGECYYIFYRGRPVGDVSLQTNGEIAIVLCKDYQTRHIGRRCIEEMLRLAKEKGYAQAKATIYSFNTQSQKAFCKAGFRKVEEELYVFDL